MLATLFLIGGLVLSALGIIGLTTNDVLNLGAWDYWLAMVGVPLLLIGIAYINMSWVTRVYRDDLVTFQVDGTLGSAVAGLSDCVIQARQATPRPVWNPDEKRTHDFYTDWQTLPENTTYDNGFKEQWEMFIRHVCEDAPYKYTLLEGAKGVQLAECALQSWRERRWIDVAPIKV